MNDARPQLTVCDLGLTPYRKALEMQRRLQMMRIEGVINDLLLFVEHPPVYTLGRAGSLDHLIDKDTTIEVVHTERGGQITYHGPGQVVGYLILDLKTLYLDLRRLLRAIEAAIIDVLAEFGLVGEHDPQHTGVWVDHKKIAAVGINVRRWVTMHGFALNATNDLAAFGAIVPCGIADRGVTSLAHLGHTPSLDALRSLLTTTIAQQLGRETAMVSASYLTGVLDKDRQI